MAEGISRQWIDELCFKNDIVSTIGRYVPLSRKGRTYWCCCPFHHEKTPSFAVDEGKQFYHCFGCGESGNVITFVQKYESTDFMGAVKILAGYAGMEVPAFSDKSGKEAAKRKEIVDNILALNKCAAKYYHTNLYADEGKKVLEYLERRGISHKWIKKFGLGFSLGYGQAVEYLKSQGFTEEQIRVAGIAEVKHDEKNGTSRYYDVFANRLIFPIIDNYSNVIAFGGRVLEKTDFAKYRNTSNTPAYDKSKSLYAHNLLKAAKQSHAVDYVLLAEGYIDVIALHAAGFDTAVASLGTSLTAEQAKIIKRYADKVYISYDGDAAGQKAALRGLDILANAGLNVKVVRLPDGLDPDDHIKKYGASGYKTELENAMPLFDYKLSALKSGFDLNVSDGKTGFTLAALALIKELGTAVEREEYLKKLQAMTGYSFESLQSQLGGSVDSGVKTVLTDAKPLKAEERAAKFLLYCMVGRLDFFKNETDLTGFLDGESNKEIYRYFSDNLDMTLAAALGEDGIDSGYRAALSELGFEYRDMSDAELKNYYEGCVKILKTESLARKIKALSQEYDDCSDLEKKRALLTQIVSLNQQLSEAKKSNG